MIYNKPFRPDAKTKFLWNLLNNLFLFFGLVVIWLLPITEIRIIGSLVFSALWLVFIYLPIALYIPAYFRSLEYSLDEDAIRLKRGVFWRRATTVPYAKITNIDITQGPVERMFGIYKLHVQTAGSSGNQATQAELMMVGICDAEDLKEQVMHRLKANPLPSKPTELPPTNDTQLLQAILSELSALRNDLKKQ